MQTAQFIALIVAAAAPACAAAAIWRQGGPAARWVVCAEIVAALAASIAMLAASTGEAWFVLVHALVTGVTFLFLPAPAIVPRAAFATLLIGQSAATVLVLADDLRWIAGSTILCGLIPPLTLMVASRSLSNAMIQEAVAQTSRRMLALTSIGACLIVLGLIVAMFGDAAIRARVSHQTTAFRFDWPAVRTVLTAAAAPGGLGNEIWKQLMPWGGAPMIVGFSILVGALPFHRPVGTALRQIPPALRVLFHLAAAAVPWAGVVRFLVPLMATSVADLAWLLRPLAVLMLWLGAMLVLSRGDISRLIAAAVLYGSGLIAASLALTGGATQDAIRLLLAGQLPLLCALILLLGWLQTNFDSIDFMDFSGLAKLLPRFSAMLTICVLGLCGAPLLSVFPGLWMTWTSIAAVQAAASGGILGVSLWPMLIPQLIVVWGWLRILDSLLLGPPRTPAMPSVLIDRVEIISAGTIPPRDLSGRELAAIGLLLAWAFVIGLKPGVIHDPKAVPTTIEPNSQPRDVAPQPSVP